MGRSRKRSREVKKHERVLNVLTLPGLGRTAAGYPGRASDQGLNILWRGGGRNRTSVGKEGRSVGARDA